MVLPLLSRCCEVLDGRDSGNVVVGKDEGEVDEKWMGRPSERGSLS